VSGKWQGVIPLRRKSVKLLLDFSFFSSFFPDEANNIEQYIQDLKQVIFLKIFCIINEV